MNKKKNLNSTTELEDVKIKFSFEFYDTSKKYCLSCWEKEQIFKALDRLKDVNTKTYNEMIMSSGVYRFHEVDWSKTKEKNGFPDKRVDGLPSFQFALLNINSQKTRVFGGLSKNIFYIVWFDLNHDIYG